MKGLNLSSFKKIAEDKASATMIHKDGHTLKIAKGSLPALQRKQLEKLPVHLDEGGPPLSFSPGQTYANAALPGDTNSEPVSVADDSAPAYVDPGDPNNAAYAATGPTNPKMGTEDVRPDTAIPAGSSPADGNVEMRAPASQKGPLDSITPSSVYGSALSGIRGKANAEGDYSNHLQNVDAQRIKEQQDQQRDWEGTQAGMQGDVQAALEDFKKGNIINPSHYLDSKTPVERVGTAIGLLLGGWSSGYTHQANPALEFLNKQIERDVQSQKDTQSNKANVYNAYLEKYKNAEVAENLTRATQMGIYATKIRQAADELGTPLAKANADIATAQLQQGILPLINNAHLQTAISSFENGQGQGGLGSEAQFNQILKGAAGINPEVHKELQAKYLPGVGVASVSVKPEDGEAFASYKRLNDLAKEGQDFAQQNGRTFWGTAANQQANDIANKLRLEIGKLIGLNRINEYEAGKYENLIKSPGAWNNAQAQQSFKDFRSEIAARAQADASRLGLKQFSR